MTRADSSTSPKSNVASLVLRTCWMLWGYFPLMYFAKTIVYGKAGIFSFPDLGILINLLFIIIVRYVDLRYYEGKTGDGAPATMADFRSFALKTTGFFLFFWGILHYLAY